MLLDTQRQRPTASLLIGVAPWLIAVVPAVAADQDRDAYDCQNVSLETLARSGNARCNCMAAPLMRRRLRGPAEQSLDERA
jgi:hypothetical protein